jgi:hypothetical protein
MAISAAIMCWRIGIKCAKLVYLASGLISAGCAKTSRLKNADRGNMPESDGAPVGF